ncbi:MAG: hypothetical protein ACI4Q3_01185 [Kiritimatiellia bacterium]
MSDSVQAADFSTSEMGLKRGVAMGTDYTTLRIAALRIFALPDMAATSSDAIKHSESDDFALKAKVEK